MAFELSGVVPWGRNLCEYKKMFCLTDEDKKLRIAGFGDGPACFNCEATIEGFNVTSFDPIYRFSKDQLKQRISEVRKIVMKQMSENVENYIWTDIRSLEELENIRMSAINLFLSDYERGLSENRYICHELPAKLNIPDDSYDLGLSSHFLLMYTTLGYDFHIRAMDEMLRVCKEIRIFPLVDLDANPSDMISAVIDHYRKEYAVEIIQTDYKFQKSADQLLIIRKKPNAPIPYPGM